MISGAWLVRSSQARDRAARASVPGWVLTVAALHFMVLVATSTRSATTGRDVFRRSGSRPAFGYPDQPPLVPLLCRAMNEIAPSWLLILRLRSPRMHSRPTARLQRPQRIQRMGTNRHASHQGRASDWTTGSKACRYSDADRRRAAEDYGRNYGMTDKHTSDTSARHAADGHGLCRADGGGSTRASTSCGARNDRADRLEEASR